MLDHLAAACRDARTKTGAGQTLVAALLGLNQSSVARFEAGDGWPRDASRYVSAYAAVGHVSPAAIWTDAAKRYAKATEDADLGGLPPEMVAVEQAMTAAAESQERAARAARTKAGRRRRRAGG